MGTFFFKFLYNVFSSGCMSNIIESATLSKSQNIQKNSDIGLTAPELIVKYNYPAETHEVQTEDGYILTMHRIPYGIDNNTEKAVRPVLFLMVGILCSSPDFLTVGPEKSLAFLAADQGYDVWLGNARGTTYSRKHVKYDPDEDSEFWMFSWHEIGVYDLPAMIDYALQNTSQKQLRYVGHSQGTTSFFVMLSERPDYNEKIKTMVALAPVAFMNNIKNRPLQIISVFEKPLEFLAEIVDKYEFLPHKQLVSLISTIICYSHITNDARFGLCSNILFLISGFDPQQLNETLVPVITSHIPAGASVRQFFHYAQLIVNNGKFCQYDEGPIGNMEKYGQLIPPQYNLTNIHVPITLIYSENDLLSAPKDVKTLYEKLPCADLYKVPFDAFSHLDFLFAIDVVPLVYNHTLKVLSKH